MLANIGANIHKTNVVAGQQGCVIPEKEQHGFFESPKIENVHIYLVIEISLVIYTKKIHIECVFRSNPPL